MKLLAKYALEQTAGRLRLVDGAPSSSWPAQAGHPRLTVLIAAEGVDGGPEPVPGLIPGSRHDDKATTVRLNLSAVRCSAIYRWKKFRRKQYRLPTAGVVRREGSLLIF